jgi:hypothetical protein
VATDFPIIRPGVTDDLTMQFDGVAPSSISAATWSCTVAPHSTVNDPTPSARLTGAATFLGNSTTHRFSNGIDGVIYRFPVSVTLADGRVLNDQADMSCISVVPEVIPTTDVGGATFDYDSWVTRYPEFAGVNHDLANSLWNEASLYLRNDPSSPVQDIPTRTLLLYMIMSHLAALYAGPGATSGMVGRINSKSVNGVSVSSEGFGVQGTQAWFLTTRYGASYWRATAAFRTMRYIPGPQRSFELPFRGIGRIFPWS